MVNDRFMGTAQIPVSVDGKTYFGCCAGCKQKLETQASARTAVDPVSGEPVDKASALIVRDPTGKVMYFANAATLARFRR
jgi:YHS domain-containing protein